MNPLIVSWFYKNAPQVMRGQLATRFESGSKIGSAALGGMMFNFLSKPHFVAYNNRFAADSRAFSFCKACGAMTVGWTIRDPRTLERLEREGVLPIFEGFVPSGSPRQNSFSRQNQSVS